MHTHRATLITLSLLALTACGSDGSGGSTTDSPDAAATADAAQDTAAPDSALPEDTEAPDAEAPDTAPSDAAIADTDDSDAAPDAAEDSSEPVDAGPPIPELQLNLEGVGHPRLLVGPSDREAMQRRARGEQEGVSEAARARHVEAASRVERLCAQRAPTLDPDDYDAGPLRQAADVAKACAWQAWVNGDAEAAEKARAALEGMPTSVQGFSDPGLDIHLATALASAVQAWDLLEGSGLVDASAAGERVAAFVADTERFYLNPPLQHAVWTNNHNIKLYSAMGLAALAFDDHPRAMAWLRLAQLENQRVFHDWQSVEAGGYGEGLYYQNYAMVQFLPYTWAWHRLIGPGEHAWQVDCALRLLDEGCEPMSWEVVGDLWEDPIIRAGLWSNVLTRMPDGARPPLDDGVLSGFPSGMLSSVDPRYGWDWLTQRDGMDGTWGLAGSLEVELLATFDGAAAPPEGPASRVDPALGVATLATGHGPDATWAMLLAEPPGLPLSWHGHEHPDVGSIQLFARGAYLVIDTGYPGWSRRDETSSYADHSGVLIDGQGWPIGDASDPLSLSPPTGALEVAWEDGLPPQQAAVTMTSDLGQWRRHLRLDGDDLLLVTDALQSDAPRAWQWRLHLLDQNDRGAFTPTEYGGLLHTPTCTLVVVVQGIDASASLGVEQGRDTLAWADHQTHSVLTAERAEISSTGFRAALLILDDPNASPNVSVSADAVTVGDRVISW